MLDPAPLADALTRRFGVAIVADSFAESEGQRITLRPRDLPLTQGFSIDILIGWRAIEAQFSPGTFALPLLGLMERATADQRALFVAFVRAALDDSAEVTFAINGQATDPRVPDGWPSNWRSASLSMRKSPVLLDEATRDRTEFLALTWSGRVFGTVLALLPLEPVASVIGGDAEGAVREVVVKRYERSLINRAACVELQGTRCKVCDFDFGIEYGITGDGFIEVHHVEMVSALGESRVLNPASDLVPVCSNCHSMLHRRRPPLTVEQLREIRNAAKGANR